MVKMEDISGAILNLPPPFTGSKEVTENPIKERKNPSYGDEENGFSTLGRSRMEKTFEMVSAASVASPEGQITIVSFVRIVRLYVINSYMNKIYEH